MGIITDLKVLFLVRISTTFYYGNHTANMILLSTTGGLMKARLEFDLVIRNRTGLFQQDKNVWSAKCKGQRVLYVVDARVSERIMDVP